nr:GBF-interacting protein like [Ipomoea batatas]
MGFGFNGKDCTKVGPEGRVCYYPLGIRGSKTLELPASGPTSQINCLRVTNLLHFRQDAMRPEMVNWKQDPGTQVWNAKGSEVASQWTQSKDTSLFYQEQKSQPSSLCSSIYYGGQDIYPHPQNNKSECSTYKKDIGEDEQGSVSRGNWWKELLNSSPELICQDPEEEDPEAQETSVSGRGEGFQPCMQAALSYLHQPPTPSPLPMTASSFSSGFSGARRALKPPTGWRSPELDCEKTNRGNQAKIQANIDLRCCKGSSLQIFPKIAARKNKKRRMRQIEMIIQKHRLSKNCSIPERLVMAFETASAADTPFPPPDISSPRSSFENVSLSIPISAMNPKTTEIPDQGEDESSELLCSSFDVSSDSKPFELKLLFSPFAYSKRPALSSSSSSFQSTSKTSPKISIFSPRKQGDAQEAEVFTAMQSSRRQTIGFLELQNADS